MSNLTVNVNFVGLCSFLNVYDNQALMPPPTVTLHNAPQHTAYLAWNEQDTYLDSPVSGPLNQTPGGIWYVELEAEQLTLNNDMTSTPDVDTATFGKNIASLMKYGKVKTPIFDQHRVPLPGGMPDPDNELAFMLLGAGTLSSDWETQYPYAFQDGNGNESVPARKYHRRATYSFDIASKALIVTATKYDGTLTSRGFKFKPVVSGQPVTVWIANADDLDEDLTPNPPVNSPVAEHFKYFYADLADKSADIYVPVIPSDAFPTPSTTPTNVPAGGLGTGYCGPDNQP